jgi:hypothetical protein
MSIVWLSFLKLMFILSLPLAHRWTYKANEIYRLFTQLHLPARFTVPLDNDVTTPTSSLTQLDTSQLNSETPVSESKEEATINQVVSLSSTPSSPPPVLLHRHSSSSSSSSLLNGMTSPSLIRQRSTDVLNARMGPAIVCHVFGFLSARELVIAQQVSCRWNKIGEEEHLWMKLELLDLGAASLLSKPLTRRGSRNTTKKNNNQNNNNNDDDDNGNASDSNNSNDEDDEDNESDHDEKDVVPATQRTDSTSSAASSGSNNDVSLSSESSSSSSSSATSSTSFPLRSRQQQDHRRALNHRRQLGRLASELSQLETSQPHLADHLASLRAAVGIDASTVHVARTNDTIMTNTNNNTNNTNNLNTAAAAVVDVAPNDAAAVVTATAPPPPPAVVAAEAATTSSWMDVPRAILEPFRIRPQLQQFPPATPTTPSTPHSVPSPSNTPTNATTDTATTPSSSSSTSISSSSSSPASHDSGSPFDDSQLLNESKEVSSEIRSSIETKQEINDISAVSSVSSSPMESKAEAIPTSSNLSSTGGPPVVPVESQSAAGTAATTATTATTTTTTTTTTAAAAEVAAIAQFNTDFDNFFLNRARRHDRVVDAAATAIASLLPQPSDLPLPPTSLSSSSISLSSTSLTATSSSSPSPSARPATTVGTTNITSPAALGNNNLNKDTSIRYGKRAYVERRYARQAVARHLLSMRRAQKLQHRAITGLRRVFRCFMHPGIFQFINLFVQGSIALGALWNNPAEVIYMVSTPFDKLILMYVWCDRIGANGIFGSHHWWSLLFILFDCYLQ